MGKRCPRASGSPGTARLLWLLWAHVAAMPVISLLFDQGPAQAALDCATVGVWALLAQLKLGGRRLQSLIVTVGLLSCSALLVHVSDGLPESYFHFFVMVAALSLYEDWVPFGAAVAYVLIQQGITAAIVDYDRAESPWLWALVHSAFIGALSIVCLVTWRASERNREAFRSLVESLEEGVLMVDEKGRLVTANPSATRILGMEPGADPRRQPQRPGLVLRRRRRQAAGRDQRPLRVTGATGRPQVGVPLGLRRPDGTTRWLSVSTRAVEPEREGPYTVVVSFSDVTEERKAADRAGALQRRAAAVRLRRLARPVGAAADGLELPRAAAPPLPGASGSGRRRVHRLRRRRRRPDALADRGAAGLLARRARRGAGARRARSVAADVLRSLAAAVVEAGAEIEISELPVVMGDRAQLEQLLQNLVANALKFREDRRARVWVLAEPSAKGMAQIAVADGGIGVPRDQREQVFEMFGRLHDREVYEGTGIGLAICRKIVERHGGRIWIDEREGGGAVFRFTLPVA